MGLYLPFKGETPEIKHYDFSNYGNYAFYIDFFRDIWRNFQVFFSCLGSPFYPKIWQK